LDIGPEKAGQIISQEMGCEGVKSICAPKRLVNITELSQRMPVALILADQRRRLPRAIRHQTSIASRLAAIQRQPVHQRGKLPPGHRTTCRQRGIFPAVNRQSLNGSEEVLMAAADTAYIKCLSKFGCRRKSQSS
jgi:hypothetical protein